MKSVPPSIYESDQHILADCYTFEFADGARKWTSFDQPLVELGGGGGTAAEGLPQETIYETITSDGANAYLLDTTNTHANPAINGNRKRVVKVTLTQTTVVDAVVWQMYQGGQVAQLRALIYADNAGSPGALVAAGVSVTQPRTVAGPLPIPFASPVTLQPGTYWIGAHLGSGSLYPLIPAAGLAGTTPFQWNDDTWSDGSTNPFGAASVYTAGYAFGLARKRAIGVVAGTINPEWFYSNITPSVDNTRAIFAGWNLSAPARVTHVACYVSRSYSPAVNIRLAVYGANQYSYPGALLAQTAELVNPTPGMHIVPLITPITLPAGMHFAMLQAAGTYQYGSMTGEAPGAATATFHAADSYADGPASVAGSPTILIGTPALALVSQETDYLYSIGPGIARGDSRTEAGVKTDMLSLSLYPDATTIGGLTMFQAAVQGLFDKVKVTLKRAYMATPGDVTEADLVTEFAGYVSKVEPSSTEIRLTIQSLVSRLAVQLPARKCTAQCPFQLYSAPCGVGAVAHTTTTTVAADSTNMKVRVNTTKAADYFKLGTITVGGVAYGIKKSTDLGGGIHEVELAVAMSSAPAAGTACTLKRGCDKTVTTCRDTFNNVYNFGGFPWAPREA